MIDIIIEIAIMIFAVVFVAKSLDKSQRSKIMGRKSLCVGHRI